MSKIGESMLKGAAEALEYTRGKKSEAKTHKVLIPKRIDVKAIRLKLHRNKSYHIFRVMHA